MTEKNSLLASTNVVWHHARITRSSREVQNSHRGAIVWFTGLSGSGKSTLAHAVEEALHKQGCRTYVLDGDNVRRMGEVAKLFMEAGVIVLTAFISPFRADRNRVRSLVANGDFTEVYCDASLEVCETLDVKGLYKKARAGHIAEFTGISSPYEMPENPELTVNTGMLELDYCVKQVIGEMIRRGVIQST